GDPLLPRAAAPAPRARAARRARGGRRGDRLPVLGPGLVRGRLELPGRRGFGGDALTRRRPGLVRAGAELSRTASPRPRRSRVAPRPPRGPTRGRSRG